MMISAALALYNSNEYLEAQLDSLRNQTRRIDEVILVDDGSKNDTYARVKNYIQKYNLKNWKLSRSKENKGFIKAFRKALSQCSGDVIFLCDHDDIWDEKKVETMAKIMEESRGKIQALACSFDPIDGQSKPLPKKESNKKGNNGLIRRQIEKNALNQMSFQDLAAYNISPGCTAAITKELRNKYMKFDGVLPHDWALYAIAALDDGLFYLDVPLVKYRLHDSNTLGLTRQKVFQDRQERSLTDWKQKQALTDLCVQYQAPDDVLEYMKKVENVYGLRQSIMARRSFLQLGGLALQSGSVPFFYETLGADMASLFKARFLR